MTGLQYLTKVKPIYTHFLQMKPTVITIESNGRKYSIELPWDAGLDEMRHAFRSIMFLMTFSIESIEEVVPE